jgi:hypothetical protein
MAKLGDMADLTLRYQGEPGAAKPDLGALFTNRFAGGVTMSDAEWALATQQTDFVSKMLRPSA